MRVDSFDRLMMIYQPERKEKRRCQNDHFAIDTSDLSIKFNDIILQQKLKRETEVDWNGIQEEPTEVKHPRMTLISEPVMNWATVSFDLPTKVNLSSFGTREWIEVPQKRKFDEQDFHTYQRNYFQEYDLFN